MKLIIPTKEQFDNFIARQAQSQFLQTWTWAEFQQSVGYEVRRLAVVDEQEACLATVTLISKTLFGGFTYWFCPRGPIIDCRLTTDDSQSIFEFIVANLKKIAREEKIIFFRFEPIFAFKSADFKIIRTLDLEPSQNSFLDLTLSQEKLLSAMHQKTRYNLRLAEKRGVRVVLANQTDFADWWQLLKITGQRDGFRLHSENYYQKMLALDFAKLYLAKQDGRVLAGILVVQFGDTATYVHGASANEGRSLMAPYLLQWTAIKDAKQAGLKYYDFYGVDKTKWPGVSRFKEGFGGQFIAYPGTFDLVFQRGYYKLYSMLRWVVRLINKLKF